MRVELSIMLQNSWKWKHCTKQVVKVLGIAQQEHPKSCLKIYKEIKYRSKTLMKPQMSQQMIWIPPMHRVEIDDILY
jgi:hypothetical protein